jgi:hypothetical protein
MTTMDAGYWKWTQGLFIAALAGTLEKTHFRMSGGSFVNMNYVPPVPLKKGDLYALTMDGAVFHWADKQHDPGRNIEADAKGWQKIAEPSLAIR